MTTLFQVQPMQYLSVLSVSCMSTIVLPQCTTTVFNEIHYIAAMYLYIYIGHFITLVSSQYYIKPL